MKHLVFLLLCLPWMGQAAHIIGGEITYECLGYTNGDSLSQSRTYRFTMRIYRDCQGNGADFDSGPNGSFTTSVSIYQGNTFYTTLYLEAPEVASIDPNPGNPCLIVPTIVCVEEGLYVFPELDLPIVAEPYTLAYQRCCRNNTITNIVNPGAAGATYSMELSPTAQTVCNSSPTFSAFPPIVLCANEDFVFDHSATDVDGDLLVYELCTPLLGGGTNFDVTNAPDGLAPDPDSNGPYTPVSFLAPTYTAQRPLGVDSDLHIDPLTGMITGNPALVGQFVVGVCVSEFRNGVLLSVVRRDFQFNITDCEPTVVADILADDMSDEQEFLVIACGQTDLDFINQSYQEEYISSYYWEFDIAGQTQVIDTWNASMAFPGEGSYGGRLVINPNTDCGDTAKIRVDIFPDIQADFSFAYDTCIAGPVGFTDLSTSGSGNITDWNWRFGDGQTSKAQHPSHLYGSPGAQTVALTIADINGCTDEQAYVLSYFPVPALIIIAPNTLRDCAPAQLSFNNLSAPVDDTYEVFWDFGNGSSSEVVSPSAEYPDAGTFSVYVSITSPSGCTTDTTFADLIYIEPSPVAAFTFSPTALDIFAATVKLNDQSVGAHRWYWELGDAQTSIERNPVYTFPDTGLHVITQIVTHPNGCIDSLTQWIDVVPNITYFLPNAFTPNDDGKNDVFTGTGFLRGFKDFQLRIWNRWGAEVFQTDDPDAGWDGRVRNTGRAAPPGVYVCQVQYTGPRGATHEIKAFVTLLR